MDAHVIPRSLYGDSLIGNSARLVSNDVTRHPKRSPVGVYDQELLCEKCEASFSEPDQYAHRFFNTIKADEHLTNTGEIVAELYHSANVRLLRVFFITLVWRMAFTQRGEFSQVSIGNYGKRLSDAVNQLEPDLIPEIDVVVTRLEDVPTGAMLFPSKLRISNVNGYRVCFANHSCWVKVDRRRFPSPFNLIALSNGLPLHFLVQDFENSPEREAIIKILKISRSNRNPSRR